METHRVSLPSVWLCCCNCLSMLCPWVVKDAHSTSVWMQMGPWEVKGHCIEIIVGVFLWLHASINKQEFLKASWWPGALGLTQLLPYVVTGCFTGAFNEFSLQLWLILSDVHWSFGEIWIFFQLWRRPKCWYQDSLCLNTGQTLTWQCPVCALQSSCLHFRVWTFIIDSKHFWFPWSDSLILLVCQKQSDSTQTCLEFV